MGPVLIVIGCLICAIQAIRTKRLLISALWLAGASALAALLLYLLGAPEIAVIELSVGAGLVTVLFVFAINIAGEETFSLQSPFPRLLAWALVVVTIGLLGWMILPPVSVQTLGGSQPGFSQVLWQERGGDTMLQVLLILAGVLGVIGLLSESHKGGGEGKHE
jgi:uncharacterized MnhB-related membrane protein